MTKAKQLSTLVTALLTCLMLTACGTQRFITIRTAHTPENKNIDPNIKSLVIWTLENKSGNRGAAEIIRADLMSKLQASGKYQFTVRDDKLKDIQNENMLTAAGLTNEGENAIPEGLAKVDAFIYGSVSAYFYKHISWTKDVIEYKTEPSITWDSSGRQVVGVRKIPVKVTITYHKIDANVTCSFQMIDRAGSVIETTPCPATYSETFTGTLPAGTGEGELLNTLLNKATMQFSRRIAPHIIKKEFELPGGNGYEPGRTWAESGLLDDAIGFFAEGAGKAPTDAIWHYNLGLCYEAYGDYEKAQESYRKAFNINGTDKNHMSAKTRIANKIKKRDAGEINPVAPNPT